MYYRLHEQGNPAENEGAGTGDFNSFIAHDLEEEDYELDYADSYSIEGRNLTVDMVDAIHYCGKSVYGWTANTSGAMLRIVNCGADGVITDDVRLLQTFLREQACRKAFASVY